MTEPADAWVQMCEQLAATGRRLLADDFPATPEDRAEGFRHLARLTVMALQSHLEFADVDFPAFHRYDDDAVKWGGPNVDNHYLRARIDPTGTYLITGCVDGTRDLIVSTHEGDMALEQYGVYAERQLADLEVDATGTLRIVLGGPQPPGHQPPGNQPPGNQPPGNWMPLAPEATIVMIRTYLADWNADGVAWFDIERLDRDVAPTRADSAFVGDALERAGAWVERSVDYWRRYLETSPVRHVVNRLTPPRSAAGGSDRIRYGAGWWELSSDQILLIEFEAPNADYWSFQLYSTPWFESLDVRNRLNSFTGASAAVDSDQRIRLAVGPSDPGVANWLDTEGRPSGMVSYRFVGCDNPPAPIATVIDGSAALPETMVRLDPAARTEQIRARRRGIARRFHR